MLILLGAALLALAFAGSALFSWLIRAVARRAGFVDHPGARKIHAQPIALGGGAAFFLVASGMMAAGVLFALWQVRTGVAPWLPEVLREHIPGIAARAELVFFVLLGGAVLFLVGLLDDLWDLSPWTRLTAQAVVIGALYFVSDELRVTAFVGSPAISFVYTVFWIIAMTNAFNLLDNMDGLSAGVAVVASVVFLVVAALTQQYFLAATLLVFAGSLVGFLLFNFPPATLFMGDAGSTFIGYMLGVLTTLFTFYAPGWGHNPLAAIVVPLVILAVPIYDTLSVVVIRLAGGKSIFSGDKNHFSHRLVALGMSRRSAVLTIYLVTLAVGCLAPLLLKLETGMALLVLTNVALTLVLIWLLEHTGRRGRSNAQGGAA